MKLNSLYRILILSITIVCGMSFVVSGQTYLLPSSDLGTDPYFMKINDQYKAQHNPLALQLNNPDDFRNDLINQLDTVVIYGVSAITQRQMHTYSAEGNRTQTYIEKLDNNVWAPYKQETATYDDENNQLSLTVENFDGTTWVNYKKTTRTFSAQQDLLTETKAFWVNGAWLNDLRATYQYNTSGNPVSMLIEKWTSNNWENQSFELITYDGNGNMLSSTGQLWLNFEWINNVRHTYTYDGNGNMLTAITESWEPDSWLNIYKEIYAYNTANNPSNYAGQEWNSNTSAWINDIQYSYTYNNLDYLVGSEKRNWVDGAWEYSERESFTYGLFGSLESSLMEVWNGNSYQNQSLTQSEYDEYGNAIQVYYYNWVGGNWVLNLDGLLPLTYNFNTKAETFIGSHAYAHYASLPVGINEVADLNTMTMTCQPNPAVNETSLILDFPVETVAEISLFSLTGKKIASFAKSPYSKGTHEIALSLNHLQSGLYFIVLEAVDKKMTYKLIVN